MGADVSRWVDAGRRTWNFFAYVFPVMSLAEPKDGGGGVRRRR